MTTTKTRSQLVTEIKQYDSDFVDSPEKGARLLRGMLDGLRPDSDQSAVIKTDADDLPAPRVSVSIRSQWASHRAHAARFLEHDPVAQKEFLKRLDADTISGSREYDRRFAARTEELREIVRLDAAGPRDDLSSVTKAQIAYNDELAKVSKRSQRHGGGNDAA